MIIEFIDRDDGGYDVRCNGYAVARIQRDRVPRARRWRVRIWSGKDLPRFARTTPNGCKAAVGRALRGERYAAERIARDRRLSRAEYIALGICGQCGQQPLNIGSKSRCTGCLTYHAESMARYREARRSG